VRVWSVGMRAQPGGETSGSQSMPPRLSARAHLLQSGAPDIFPVLPKTGRAIPQLARAKHALPSRKRSRDRFLHLRARSRARPLSSRPESSCAYQERRVGRGEPGAYPPTMAKSGYYPQRDRFQPSCNGGLLPAIRRHLREANDGMLVGCRQGCAEFQKLRIEQSGMISRVPRRVRV
jgi:hypothetical protein